MVYAKCTFTNNHDNDLINRKMGNLQALGKFNPINR